MPHGGIGKWGNHAALDWTQHAASLLGGIIIYEDNGLLNGGNHAGRGTACCAATFGEIIIYGINGY